MNRLIISGLFLVSFFAVQNVAAQEATTARIDVTEKNCAHISKYVAEQDVTYKPGVDVRGKSVKSADLNDNQIKLPDIISINLSLPLQDLYKTSNPPNRALQNAEVNVGVLEYSISSGRMTFNGQELSDPALHAIAAECQKTYGNAK